MNGRSADSGCKEVVVSVVIPTYDRARLLEEAVRSILRQDGASYEIVVIDDGSSDDTQRRCEALGKFESLQYIYQPNAGRSSARNRGIACARGEWVLFLDSDDVLLPGALSALLATSADSPEAALVAGSTGLMDATGRSIAGGLALSDCKAREVYGLAIRDLYFSMGSYIVRRDLVANVGGFRKDLEPCEDYDFCLRVCAAAPVATTSAPILNVRAHSGNSSSSATKHSGIKIAHEHLRELSRETIRQYPERRKWRAAWLLNLADDHYSLGDYSAAWRNYVQAIAVDPRHVLNFRWIRQVVAAILLLGIRGRS